MHFQVSVLNVVKYLFDERHEAVPEAPGFVSVTLERADCDLRRLLHRYGHHVHCIVHQCCIGLEA